MIKEFIFVLFEIGHYLLHCSYSTVMTGELMDMVEFLGNVGVEFVVD